MQLQGQHYHQELEIQNTLLERHLEIQNVVSYHNFIFKYIRELIKVQWTDTGEIFKKDILVKWITGLRKIYLTTNG